MVIHDSQDLRIVSALVFSKLQGEPKVIDPWLVLCQVSNFVNLRPYNFQFALTKKLPFFTTHSLPQRNWFLVLESHNWHNSLRSKYCGSPCTWRALLSEMCRVKSNYKTFWDCFPMMIFPQRVTCLSGTKFCLMIGAYDNPWYYEFTLKRLKIYCR